MVKLSIVQGRLSPPIGGRYQHFPIETWRKEFPVAARLGIDGIEWIVSDFSNPLFDQVALDEAARLSRQHGVAVTSISLDVLMYQPIFRLSEEELTWMLDRVAAAAQSLGAVRVSIPIEENSGIRNPSDAEAARRAFKLALAVMGHRVEKPCIETDLSPADADALLGTPGLERMGLLVDLGNIAANGFALREFQDRLSGRIFGLHIKDRKRGLGPSCPLGTGDAELTCALSEVSRLPHVADITLQSFRTNSGFVDDARQAVNFVRRFLKSGPV